MSTIFILNCQWNKRTHCNRMKEIKIKYYVPGVGNIYFYNRKFVFNFLKFTSLYDRCGAAHDRYSFAFFLTSHKTT